MYTPEPLLSSPSLEYLAAYVHRELQRLSGELQSGSFNVLLIPTLHAEPSKPRENLIVGADGTDWDPGSGQGIYAYYNSVWNKLG